MEDSRPVAALSRLTAGSASKSTDAVAPLPAAVAVRLYRGLSRVLSVSVTGISRTGGLFSRAFSRE